MRPRIAFVGAGAVGGWVGGHLADAGHDVTLIEPWPEHVAAIRQRGLELSEPGSTKSVAVKALHIADAQTLHRTPLDVAFICVKLYDTDWAVALIAPYLAPAGFVVTLQNGLVEERVASHVGWGRTVGCVGGGLQLEMIGPGHIKRNRPSLKGAVKAFHVGEVHGRITPRITAVADLLSCVDGAEVITNLWGLRWAKLTANCMTSALCAVTGIPMRELFEHRDARRIMTLLAAQAIAVGAALGYEVEKVLGLDPDRWIAASAGDHDAIAMTHAIFARQTVGLEATASSGMAQDFRRDRRSEIDFMNGFVDSHARTAGLRAPMHSALADLVKAIEGRRSTPGRSALEHLMAVANGT